MWLQRERKNDVIWSDLKLGEPGCILVYRYTKEGNINELRHNFMYGYQNNRNSLVYRYTRTAPGATSNLTQFYIKV